MEAEPAEVMWRVFFFQTFSPFLEIKSKSRGKSQAAPVLHSKHLQSAVKASSAQASGSTTAEGFLVSGSQGPCAVPSMCC